MKTSRLIVTGFAAASLLGGALKGAVSGFGNR